MADNAPGEGFLKPRPPRRWTTPIIIAISVGLAALVSGLFIKGILGPVQTDGPAGLSGAITASFRATFLKSFVPAMHDGCVKSADTTLASKGADPSANGMAARIEAYCGCVSDHATHEFSIPELISLQSPPSPGPAATKLTGIVRECQAKTATIGR